MDKSSDDLIDLGESSEGPGLKPGLLDSRSRALKRAATPGYQLLGVWLSKKRGAWTLCPTRSCARLSAF